MLNPDIFCFKNSVDPDQLLSKKPADQDPVVFFNSAYQQCKLLNGLKFHVYIRTCVKWPLSKRPQIGFQDQLSLNAGQKY